MTEEMQVKAEHIVAFTPEEAAGLELAADPSRALSMIILLLLSPCAPARI